MKLRCSTFCALALLAGPAGAQDIGRPFSWDEVEIITLDGPYEYNDGSGTLGFITDINEEAEGKVAFLTCDSVILSVFRRDLFETQAQCDESRERPPRNLTAIEIMKRTAGAFTITGGKDASLQWDLAEGSQVANAMQAAISGAYGEISAGQTVPAVAFEQTGQTFLGIITPAEHLN